MEAVKSREKEKEEEIEEIEDVLISTMLCDFKNISSFGEVYLEFSEDIRFPEDAEKLDSTQLSVEVLSQNFDSVSLSDDEV